jgi:hypothetical protein
MQESNITGVTPKKYLQIGHLGDPGNGIKTVSAILLEAGFQGRAGEAPVERNPNGMSGLETDVENRWRLDVPYATAIGRLQSTSSTTAKFLRSFVNLPSGGLPGKGCTVACVRDVDVGPRRKSIGDR